MNSLCSPWRYPPESTERKEALRRAWVEEFGHDRCSYCDATLSFPGHSAKTRGLKGYKPDPLEAQRDHDFPAARMGPRPWEDRRWWRGPNIVPACRTCNIKKGAKTGAEFRATLTSKTA